MTTTVKHPFESAKADGPDSTLVKPSDWNNDHDMASDSAGFVLGRDTSGSGAIQELPLEISPIGDVTTTGSGFVKIAVGTSAQRPGAPANGQIRYNSDLSCLEAYGADGSTNWVPILVGNGVPVGATLGWNSNTAPDGFLFHNGQTLGSGTSGADNASNLYQALFLYIWTNLSNPSANAICPVVGGIGLTAAADWAANKKITLPNECGAVSAGANNMGGVPSNNALTTAIGGVDGDTLGASGGSQGILQTLGMMPDHEHDGIPGGGSTTPSTGGGSVLGVQLDATTTGNVTGYPGAQLETPVVQLTVIKNVIVKF